MNDTQRELIKNALSMATNIDRKLDAPDLAHYVPHTALGKISDDLEYLIQNLQTLRIETIQDKNAQLAADVWQYGEPPKDRPIIGQYLFPDETCPEEQVWEVPVVVHYNECMFHSAPVWAASKDVTLYTCSRNLNSYNYYVRPPDRWAEIKNYK